MQEKTVFGALGVYREQGYYLKRLEQFSKAKAAFDEGFSSDPDNVRNLIGRSRVCASAIQPFQAYADAKLALRLEPRNMNAYNVQAQALYTMSDFEHSVVTNYRGLQIRRQPPYFIEGISQGIQTIQDCIGSSSDNILLNHLPLIRHQEGPGKQAALNISSHKCRIPQPRSKAKVTQIQAREHLVLSRVLAMKYLGPMAYDKFFLERLMKDRRINSANTSGSDQIRILVKQALTSLTESQEMLREQRPYFTIKIAEKSESKHLNKFRKSLLHQERDIAARMAERLYKEIKDCLDSNRVKDLIIRAERFQKFLDSKSVKVLPDKEFHTDRLYRMVGEAYLSQHRLSYSLSDKSNRRRIAFLMGLSTGRPTSFDSVVANYPHKNVDIKFVTEKVSKSLEVCENASMKCWLTYELARLLCMQKQYALSKFYAKRCQREAQDIGSNAWWLNGCFVLLSGDMRQGNSNEVRIQVEEAYEWSKRMQDPERVQTFLFECARMASETVSADERKAIERREKQILAVMDEEQRVETGVLFKRMSVLPPGRRFQVMPCKASPKQDKSERTRNKQKGISVIPGIEHGIPKVTQSGVAGYQTFEI